MQFHSKWKIQYRQSR